MALRGAAWFAGYGRMNVRGDSPNVGCCVTANPDAVRHTGSDAIH